jgi:hypothetical protein
MGLVKAPDARYGRALCTPQDTAFDRRRHADRASPTRSKEMRDEEVVGKAGTP